jgi:hypothetical protein
MKVPPRSMLVAQIWGTILGAIVNYVVMDWIVDAVDLLHNPDREFADGTSSGLGYRSNNFLP